MASQDLLSPSTDITSPFDCFSTSDYQCQCNNLTGQLEEVNPTPFAGGGYADVFKYRAGPCYLGPDNGTGLFAVKRPRIFAGDRRKATMRLLREIDVWNSLEHDNILKLHGIIYPREDRIPSLVSDFMENGTAERFLKDCPEPNLRQMICDIARGLMHLHRNDIAHGDIKGNNILIGSDGRGRIADFGLSRMLGSDGRALEVTTTDGNRTNRWHAIEYFDLSNRNYAPTKPADVWSFGCTILELFSGKLPFYDLKEPEIGLRLAAKDRPKFPPSASRPEFETYRPAIVALCHLCWTRNPDFRPQMSVLEDIICSDYWDATRTTSETQERKPQEDATQPEKPPRPPGSDSGPTNATPSDGSRSRSSSQATLVSSPPTDEGSDFEIPFPQVVEPEEEPQPDPVPEAPAAIPVPPPPSLEDVLRSKRITPQEILNETSMGTHRFRIQYEDGGSTGPPHLRTHVVKCKIDDEVFGVGRVPGKKKQAKERAALLALQRLYIENPSFLTSLCYTPILTRYIDDNDLSARARWDRLSGPSAEDPSRWEHRATFIFDGNTIATGVGPSAGIAEEDAARKVQLAWT